MLSENDISKKNLTKIQTRCLDSCTSPENPTYYREMPISPKVTLTKGNFNDYLTETDNISPNKTGHTIGSRYRSPSPVNRSLGFKIKGDDGNITKYVEWSSTRIELSDFHTPFLINPSSTTESKLTDSGSELYDSYCCSTPQRNLHLTNFSINNSDSQSKGLLSREGIVDQKLSPSKLFKSNLSCGGVQIHSYKEKQISEDIVFQGEWQQHNQQSREKLKKTPTKPSMTRNFTEIANKKRKIASTDKPGLKKLEQKFEVKTEMKKPAHVRIRAFKSKQETVSKTEQIKKTELPKNQVRTTRNKNVLKVSICAFFI